MIHTVYDITDCAVPDPPSASLLQAMHATARLLGCTVLGELPITFQPHGTTCVVVLAESHLTVSTWPEHRLAHIDLFTCRADTHPDDAIAPVVAALGGGTVAGQRISRRGRHNHHDSTTIDRRRVITGGGLDASAAAPGPAVDSPKGRWGLRP